MKFIIKKKALARPPDYHENSTFARLAVRKLTFPLLAAGARLQ